MRDSIKVSVVQFTPTWLDRRRNAERMVEFVEREAREHDADLVVFPELASTGYLSTELDDDFVAALRGQAEPIPGPTTELLSTVARESGTHIVAGICELPDTGGRLLNSAAYIGPEGIIGVYRKVHLALSEKDVFTAGNVIEVHDTDLGRVGLSICYDVRFPELARSQALDGAELLVSIWAMWEQPGKAPNDSIIVRCRSRATENYAYVVGCNRSGVEGTRRFFGRSVIVSPSGEAIAVSDDDSEAVLRAELSGADLREQRDYMSVLDDRRPDLYARLVQR